MSPKDQMCPHFAVGKCFYGNNCKYKHPGQNLNANLYYTMPGQPLPYDQSMMMNHMAYGNPMMMNHAMTNLGEIFFFLYFLFAAFFFISFLLSFGD
jgi:hypothetical protein